jgi:uncharacterized protein with FMN-binding domain
MKTFTTRFASAAISLFAATGTIAHAGEVISDQRYWPSEEIQNQRYWPNEAYGYGYYTGRTRPAFNAMASMDAAAPTTGSSFVYRGGPKTGTRDYIREW